MKKLRHVFLATGFIFSLSQFSFSQEIDWKSYQDPDGDFKRLFVSPEFNYQSIKNVDSDYGTFDLSLRSTFELNKIRNLSILRFNVIQSLGYDRFKNRKSSADPETRFAVQINPSVSYRKYLKSRRGLFLEGFGQVNARHQSNSNNKFTDFTRLTGYLGFGRIENVAPLYQAIRIKKQTRSMALDGQESLFALAHAMRLLDYNTTLDNRMLSIDNQTIYLNTLKDLGVSLDGFESITNALDAYIYERPSYLGNGFEGKVGLQYQTSIDEGGSDILGILSLGYAKAINNQWHWRINTNFSSDVKDSWSTSFSTRLSYLPNARTTISLSQNILHRDLDTFSLTNSSTSLNVRYFVSPYVSVFGNMGYAYSGDTGIIDSVSSHNFNQNIGFNYFIF